MFCRTEASIAPAYATGFATDLPDEVYVLAPVAAYAAGLFTRAPEEVYTPLLPLRLYGDEWPRLLARPLAIWAGASVRFGRARSPRVVHHKFGGKGGAKNVQFRA